MKKYLCAAAVLLLLFAASALGEACSHSWIYLPEDDTVHKRSCTKCGASEQVSHTFTTNRVAPTCTDAGYVEYTCPACGYSTRYTEDPATGAHVFGGYEVITEPTCTSEGLEKRTCTVCGQTEEVTLSPADHVFGDYSGYGEMRHSRSCTVCGYKEIEEHDTSISKVITTARDTRLGKKECTCVKCGISFTCFYSVYDTLYGMKGTDIPENGASYLKVNTVTLPAGNSRVIDLYSEGTFELTSGAGAKAEVYASAESGRFTGLYLVSGDALLTIDGAGAGIEFIKVDPSAALRLSITNGSSLTLSCKEGRTAIVSGGNSSSVIIRGTLENGILNGSAVRCEGNRLTLSGSGDELQIAGSKSQCAASFTYDTQSHTVSISTDSSVTAKLCSETGVCLATSDGGTLTAAVEGSWYIFFTGSFAPFNTPVIDTMGAFGPTAAIVDENKPEEPVSSEADTQPDEDGRIHPSTVIDETVSENPAVKVHIENGVYSVTVTSLPKGATFDSILFIQNYTYAGQHRLVSYNADAAFPFDPADSTLSAVVILSSGGKKITCPAGSYGFTVN